MQSNIIAVTDTKLSTDTGKFTVFLSEYVMIRRGRELRGGDGLALFVRENSEA